MPIQKNSVVELAYELYDDQGQQIVHDGAPLTYLHGGYHGTFPKVEAALEGKNIGDEILPPEIKVDDILEGEDGHGHIRYFRVTDMDDTHATLNGNHPLAGLTLRFKAKVQSLREATTDEIAHGHVHGPHGHHHHH